ncbi:porin [Thermocrinis sp.]|uniref:porin n=1 Tax=Thermocrinis sp. TaxID=2024383 RepID=UPI003C06EBC6
MRKSLLAMAALMGVATLPAHAWRVNIDKDTFADITFATQIVGTAQGKRTNAPTDHNATNFAAKLVTIGASGQVNKLVYFGITAESPSPGLRSSFVTRDAFVGLKFADEFRVQAGAMRIPFSRATLTSSYNFLIPTQDVRDIYYEGLRIDPIDGQSVRGDAGERNRDAGIVVWGNVAGGMLKYYLGVTDGRYDRRTGPFGTTNTKDNLAYTIRLQFTPTMLGFKPEKGYSLADTYLGRQNVLTLGVGYRTLKAQTTGLSNLTPPRYDYSKTAKLWTADMLYEQKFGNLIPNLQVGYINAKDVTYRYIAPNVLYGTATQIYAQGQLLYDQVVGFGKPALAIRWEENKNKDLSTFNTTTGQTSVDTREPKDTRVGVFVNYYIKGQDARIAFGVDTVNRNRDSKRNDPSGSTGKNFTDFTLYLQTRF